MLFRSLSAISGTVGAINGVLGQFRNLWEQVVYPLQLINRARALVSSMIAQFRGLLTALMRVNVSSAQLPNPVLLESSIRNRGTGDFAQLTNAFGQTYRAIPQPTDAHPIERDLADIDDAMALANLKTLKASDAMVDQMMAAANAIEDEGVNMAPGEAPFLAAAGMTASVKSQAMMQRMIAAATRAITHAPEPHLRLGGLHCPRVPQSGAAFHKHPQPFHEFHPGRAFQGKERGGSE